MCILLHLLQCLFFYIVHLFSSQHTFKLRLSLYLCFMATRLPFCSTTQTYAITYLPLSFSSIPVSSFWLNLPPWLKIPCTSRKGTLQPCHRLRCYVSSTGNYYGFIFVGFGNFQQQCLYTRVPKKNTVWKDEKTSVGSSNPNSDIDFICLFMFYQYF